MRNIFSWFLPLCMLSSATCLQTHFYPLIFIHGHGGNLNIENTWDYLIEKNLKQADYHHFGKIWSETSNDLQNNSLSSRTVFQFGFYRENPYQYFIQYSNIGLIPYKCSVRHYCGIADSIKCSNSTMTSYAERLSITISNILRATGVDKVDIIAHGMGGLIARSYIRWGGGKTRVHKLLLVGTPNNGLSQSTYSELEKIYNPQYNWQQYGEYIEMAENNYFDSNSYFYWLNKGWYQFTTKYDILYATIRGHFNPWKSSSTGNYFKSDGIIDDSSAILKGSVFNGIVYAAHFEHINFPKDLAHRFGYEEALPTSTYTALVIKRWIIGNLVSHARRYHVQPRLQNRKGNAGLLFSIRQGHPLVSIVQIYDADNQWLSSYGLPINQGSYLPKIMEDITPIMPPGRYQMRTTIYSMKNVLYNKLTWFAKQDSNSKIGSPKANLLKKPNKVTDEIHAKFVVSSNTKGMRYAYILDDDDISEYNVSNKITLKSLNRGIHTIFIIYSSETLGDCEKPLEYTWLITNPMKSPTTSPKIRKEILIDNFENYTVGRLKDQGHWKQGSHDASCGPVIMTDAKRGKYVRSSSCFWSQGVVREYNFNFNYLQSDSYIQFTGLITSGSGNNAGSLLHIYNSKDTNQGFLFGYVNCLYDCPNVNHQTRIMIGPGQNLYGDHLSPARWYDFRLNIDWTYSKKGRVCLQYKVTGAQIWKKDSKLCNKELAINHSKPFDRLKISVSGISARLGAADDIIVYY